MMQPSNCLVAYNYRLLKYVINVMSCHHIRSLILIEIYIFMFISVHTTGQGFDQISDELDETRKFNFWTHQLFIFFVMKFFPAYHNHASLNQLVKERSANKSGDPNHANNCICRGKTPPPPPESEKPATTASAGDFQASQHPETPALSVPEE